MPKTTHGPVYYLICSEKYEIELWLLLNLKHCKLDSFFLIFSFLRHNLLVGIWEYFWLEYGNIFGWNIGILQKRISFLFSKGIKVKHVSPKRRKILERKVFSPIKASKICELAALL